MSPSIIILQHPPALAMTKRTVMPCFHRRSIFSKCIRYYFTIFFSKQLLTMDQQDGFFSVLRQIQAVEKSFTNILMEAAYKMSKLTQSQMFILIETPEGRTFTGSPNLCQTYSTGDGLFGLDSDVHLRLDGEVPQRTGIGRKRREPSDENHDEDHDEDQDQEEDNRNEDGPDEDRRDDDRRDEERRDEDGLDENSFDAFEDSSEWTPASGASKVKRAKNLPPCIPALGPPKESEESSSSSSSWLPGKGTSEVWKYFERNRDRPEVARCTICQRELMRTLIRENEIDQKFD